MNTLFWTGRSRPKACGVIYQDANGVFHKAKLAKNAMSEVILCAGAIGSPQLLMLSGVGPKSHLEAHGVIRSSINPWLGKGWEIIQ